MSNFIHLDSLYRDREEYPNENDYQVTPQQVETWIRPARAVKAFPANPNLQPIEFSTTVNISNFMTPYTPELASLPVIYVNFRSLLYDDQFLVYTINGKHNEVKFVCIIDRVQNDSDGNPIWIHWKSSMEQALRFRRGYPVIFRITTRSGDILPQTDNPPDEPPNPSQQTLITFEVSPYIRDGSYESSVDPLS